MDGHRILHINEVKMKSFDKILEKSIEFGVHESKESLMYTVNSFLLQIPRSSSSISDETGCRWIDIYDMDNNLCCILHRYYRVAFILKRINAKNTSIYCVYVNDFCTDEWYIDDLKKINEKYHYLHWDEPVEVVDPKQFNILDMEFATE